ncbi:MAG: DUF692 domain-containing protein [Kangiellaceae bacterium]|nr:DUF692 domain-containing protein [Kangiellaceae bacterium]
MNLSLISGVGLGFREEHEDEILVSKPPVDWFELLIDNYLSSNANLQKVDQLAKNYPICFHGVGLSIGSPGPIDRNYLSKIKLLIDRWQPIYYSDHLSWSAIAGQYFHELLPMPHTTSAISYLVERINLVQDYLGQQILLENPSTYDSVPSEMPEWQFINEVCRKSGCGLLLDINNVHVNAFNHQFDATEYLHGIDTTLVKEIHLAGYEDYGDYYFDSHSRPITEQVWNSYAEFLTQSGNLPTLIEWDNDLPQLEVLMAEASKAQLFMQNNQGNNLKKTVGMN